MSDPRLNVYGRNIEIVISELDGQLGEYDTEALSITLDPTADYWPTLVHEVVHALTHRLGIHFDEHLEEVLCDGISAAICENFTLEHRGHTDGEDGLC